jgi:hypothetical protein
MTLGGTGDGLLDVRETGGRGGLDFLVGGFEGGERGTRNAFEASETDLIRVTHPDFDHAFAGDAA